MTIYVLCAMMGCWSWESGCNPGIWESLKPKDWHYTYGTDGPNQGGFGLGQWTNTQGNPNGRLWQLHSWVTSNGYTDGDGNGQCAYVLVENLWYPKSISRLHYQTLEEFLNSDSQSLDDLVWDFLACWEGVVGDRYSERLAYARQAYDHILAHQNDDPSTYQWKSYNNWTSEADRLNNYMCIYFFYQGYVPTDRSRWIFRIINNLRLQKRLR